MKVLEEGKYNIKYFPFPVINNKVMNNENITINDLKEGLEKTALVAPSPSTVLEGLPALENSLAVDPLEEESLIPTDDLSSKQKAELSRKRTRASLHYKLKYKGVKLVDLLLNKAIEGNMRDADCLKLLDLLCKYSIGAPVEITGVSDGPQIVMGFSMNNGTQTSAGEYLESIKQRVINNNPNNNEDEVNNKSLPSSSNR